MSRAECAYNEINDFLSTQDESIMNFKEGKTSSSNLYLKYFKNPSD
ncbi:MAG: hypothetical protein MJ232_08010 [archaeon]|nr:hypothetical protein [archaeon]